MKKRDEMERREGRSHHLRGRHRLLRRLDKRSRRHRNCWRFGKERRREVGERPFGSSFFLGLDLLLFV